MPIKLTYHSIENQQASQEETPVEDTVTVSLREYQMMKEALEDMKRKNTAEIKGKTVIERTITPQQTREKTGKANAYKWTRREQQ